MLKTEQGPFLYQFVKGAASLSFTPISDRGALVTDIAITNPSANDTWVVSSKGKEIMRLRLRTTGNQNAVRRDDKNTMPHLGFFDYCRWLLSQDPSIPVPLGQTLTISSVGGATANIYVEFEEHDTSDLGPSLLNHPDGKEWLVPVYTWLNAAQTAIGPTNDDTQVGPAWLPNFLIGTLMTSAWRVQLLGAFMEGVGVNTFSGAANHQSTTERKLLVLNSRILASRTTTGIPNLGSASAAGSANTVLGQEFGPYQPFEHSGMGYAQTFDNPIVLRNGDTFNVQEQFVGDLTGGADYSGASTIWVARVSELV